MKSPAAVETEGPYAFTADDMEPDRLMLGVEHTLEDYYRWREQNPATIADYVDLYTEHLSAAVADQQLPSVLGRRLVPPRQKDFQHERLVREAEFFGIFNLGELLEPEAIERYIEHFRTQRIDPRSLSSNLRDTGVKGVIEAFEQYVPALQGADELGWLGEQLDRLYRMVPETVVQEGGVSKAVRTTLGVLAIGAYDTFDEDSATSRDHLLRILPAAYAYGATYPLIDDTLQDMPGEYVSEKDKKRYHRTILQGLTTGGSVDMTDLPDHPIAEELERIYNIVRERFPIDAFPHLYQASEAMYLAQHRDANKTADEVAVNGLQSMYPDIFIKAGMSRVVANILGRRALTDDFYARCTNTLFLSQFRNDLEGREEDGRAGRLTPFTYPLDLTQDNANPLYDVFAYGAYTAHRINNGDPRAVDTLSYMGATSQASG